MRVMPQLIRALGLEIDKLVRGIPLLDFRQPSKRNAPHAQRISDGGSLLHRDGQWSQDPESHPGRSDALQVFGAREEIEDLRKGVRNAQFTLECVSHGPRRSLETCDESA